MKLTFEQPDLLKSVNISMKAISSSTTMPILECIMIDASAGEIKFISNDMELGIETIVSGTIIEKGSIALPAKTFSEIVKSLPNSRVTIETNEYLTANITCEKAHFEIPGKPGDEFAYLPVVERDDRVTMTQFSLRQIINQTLFSVGENVGGNKALTGELFKIENNHLQVVSLDSHRVSIRNLELQTECPDVSVIIPGKTLGEISRLLTGGLEDEVTVYFAKNYVIFEFDQTMVLSRLLEGHFFDVGQLLINDYSTKVEMNKQNLVQCIGRASLLVRESDKVPVVFDIRDDVVRLSANTAMGSMQEDLEIHKEGKDLVIGFNPKFMIDALRVIDDETITMYFLSSVAPCFIKNEEEGYNYIILPVNIGR